MVILIVTTRFPKILGKPDSFTVYNIIKHLSRRHDIILVSSYENESDIKKLPDLKQYCKKIYLSKIGSLKGYLNIVMRIFNFLPFQVNYFYNKNIYKDVIKACDVYKPDIVYSHLIRATEYVKNCKIYKILAYQISQTLNYKRLIAHKKFGIKKILYYMEYLLVNKYERRIAAKFDKLLFIGEADYKSLFTNKQYYDKIFYSPHGIDVQYYTSKNRCKKKSSTLLFPANFSPETNRDAAKWLINDIYPILFDMNKDIKIIFAGSNPPNYLKRFSNKNKNITVTGFITDIRPYYEMSDILINPVRACAGQQNKILSGMAMGLPVVSTREANEAINAKNYNQILLVDTNTPEMFAQNIIELLNNDSLRNKISKNGRELVEKCWTWDYHLNRLENMLINTKQTHE